MRRPESNLEPRVKSELFEDVLDVRGNGPLRDDKLLCDLAIG